MLKKNSIVNSIDCPRKMPRKRRGRPWIFLRCRGRPWIFFAAVPITTVGGFYISSVSSPPFLANFMPRRAMP